jgi:hypothetical protein
MIDDCFEVWLHKNCPLWETQGFPFTYGNEIWLGMMFKTYVEAKKRGYKTNG